jgi:23S rRNA (cytosine1962-C5)-methyltransferase
VLDLWRDFDADWIVYEDDDLIAIDKPAGVPSQAADPAHDDDVVSRLKRWLGSRRAVAPDQIYLGVHQRLDRDTSGVMVYALRREANAELARQFEGRAVTKTYVAGARAPRDLSGERVLRDALARGRDGRMHVAPSGAHGAREAITRVRVQARHADRALLELGCDTGRTHQLRVQLAHAGAPIAGDRLYGGSPALRLLLHAKRLRLQHPNDGRALDLCAAVPCELEHWLAHGPIDAARDPKLLRRALSVAVEARYRLGRSLHGASPTSAFRLLHGDAEGLPDVAVDLYGDFLVLHLLGDVPEERERDVLDALAALGPTGIHVKRHARQKNELGDARDSAWAPARAARGATAEGEIVVHEYGLPFGVRLGEGLRTGLFLDQRENRQRVRRLASGKRVLNLFAYTGGFSLSALAGGASDATCVDASAGALAWAQRNIARIGASERHRTWHTDAFDALAQLGRRRERFDVIVVDPPSYASTRSRRFVALKHYASLCEAALRVLAPGGTMLACINHHGARQNKLRRDVARAVEAVGRTIVAMKDVPPQLDFPPAIGSEPLSKSVLLTCD